MHGPFEQTFEKIDNPPLTREQMIEQRRAEKKKLEL